VTTPKISVDRLADMIAGLDDHIRARADQIAAPRIAAAEAAASARIAEVEQQAATQAQRDADLIAELRRHLVVAERTITRLRATVAA